MRSRIIHGSLFSGIGGFDLAAQWMGWENAFHCEWNAFCQRLLNFYWPNATSYGDITKTDFTVWRSRIHILTGGFPCQPYSGAGLRKGKNDERHLWPEMLRAIREIRAPFVVGENVPGLVTWSDGMVFEEVYTDLENEGYEVFTFNIPSASLGATHQRERIWFVAYSDTFRRETSKNLANGSGKTRKLSKRSRTQGTWFEKTNAMDTPRDHFSQFQQRHGKPAIFNEHDGIPFELDGITVPKWLEESISGAGNAITPQVAVQIFEAIQSFIQLEQ